MHLCYTSFLSLKALTQKRNEKGKVIQKPYTQYLNLSGGRLSRVERLNAGRVTSSLVAAALGSVILSVLGDVSNSRSGGGELKGDSVPCGKSDSMALPLSLLGVPGGSCELAATSTSGSVLSTGEASSSVEFDSCCFP